MRHVVIGGSGLVGTAVVESLLGGGSSVVVVDHRLPAAHLRGIEYWSVDLTRPWAVSERLILAEDDVVHFLASRQYADGLPRRDIRQWFDAVIVDGLTTVLDIVRRAGCTRVIYFSTDMVYGRPRSNPVAEDHPLNPIGHYSRSKAQAEGICRDQRAHGVNVTIFRPRLIIGPGRLGVLSRMFWFVRRGLPLPLIGDGTNRYQMVAVEDCASAVVAAVAHGVPNRTFNLGSEEPPTVRDLLESLIRSVDSRTSLIKTPASVVKAVLRTLEWSRIPVLYGDQYEIADVDYVVSTKRATQELDWRPKHHDSDMIRQAYDSYVSAIG